jgi:GxxExxY protein
MTQLIHKELTYVVRGVLFDIYNHLGPRLPEEFYQKAITFALREQGIICEPEKQFEVIYRNQSAGKYYVDHWLENGKLILEIKVAPNIRPIHQAQTISYLKLTNADLAIIANFGTQSLQDKRLPNFIRNKIVKFEWQPPPVNQNILYSELTDHILESLHQVHFTLGPGFIHRVYRQAVMIDLQYQGIGYEYIKKIQCYYKNYYIDEQKVQMIKIENKVLLGVFAVEMIDEVMLEVMKARMKRLKTKVGFLANFYGEQLKVERMYSTS